MPHPLVTPSAGSPLIWNNRHVTVSVSPTDAFDAPVDALVLKYAQAPHGAERESLQRLKRLDTPGLPEPGAVLALPTNGIMAPPMLILVGTIPLEYFDYAATREFGRAAIAASAKSPARVERLGMTMHGVSAGLDEAEAFTALVAGFLDALRRDEWPHQLASVTIYEKDVKRAKRIGGLLAFMLNQSQSKPGTFRQSTGSEALDTAGIGSRSKPHAFVAMPFGPDTDDLFHYGIQSAINASGFLCERVDAVAYTGDILGHIKARIDSASLLVAELSTANPNVYLEVGYAWGRNIRTVLVAREAKLLRFDVQGQRIVFYTSIRELEQKLTRELQQLAAYTP